MKYLKSSQFVPSKGDAWTLYELDDQGVVLRILTHIPETGEITLYPKPKVKTIFQPERLLESSFEEFDYVWQEGEARNS